MAWKEFFYDPNLNIMSTQKDITGDTRFVQDSEVIKWHQRALPAQIPLISISSH